MTDIDAQPDVMSVHLDTNDIVNVLKIIDFALDNGAFRGVQTLQQVLSVRNKIERFVNVAEKAQAQADAAAAQAAAQALAASQAAATEPAETVLAPVAAATEAPLAGPVTAPVANAAPVTAESHAHHHPDMYGVLSRAGEDIE